MQTLFDLQNHFDFYQYKQFCKIWGFNKNKLETLKLFNSLKRKLVENEKI